MTSTQNGSISPGLRRIQAAALRLFAETGSTHLNVSDLAQAAGVARGTIYNNLPSTDGLFEQIAGQLSSEMSQRILAMLAPDDDPALRLAYGIRCFLRRAHDEPDWGRFLCRFALNNTTLLAVWNGPAMADLHNGFERGRFKIQATQVPSMIALIGGTVLGAMFLVLEGHKSWREAGADAVELTLRGMGIDADEARALAALPLPPLPPLTDADS